MLLLRKTPALKVAVVAVAALVLGMAGCAPSPSPLAPASENAAMVSNLFFILFAVAVVVFVIVEFMLFYSLIRFRRKSGDGMPEQIHGNTRFEIAWTVAPALVLAVVFVLTWQTLNALATTPANALNVRVIGHQWWWEIQYPDSGVVTANEIHLPVNQAAYFSLESIDVIHSFWVPELSGKTDLIPGHINHTWFRPDKVGQYHGQCAEFCGTGHANMRFEVIVQTQADFDAWVAAQKAPPATPNTDLAQKGEQTFMAGACIGCHTINGTTAKGQVGPNLTHVASRQTIAGGILNFTSPDLHTWLRDPPAVKPGSLMPNLNLTPDQIDALVAYLQSLK